jgi:hypothetical protein
VGPHQRQFPPLKQLCELAGHTEAVLALALVPGSNEVCVGAPPPPPPSLPARAAARRPRGAAAAPTKSLGAGVHRGGRRCHHGLGRGGVGAAPLPAAPRSHCSLLPRARTDLPPRCVPQGGARAAAHAARARGRGDGPCVRCAGLRALLWQQVLYPPTLHPLLSLGGGGGLCGAADGLSARGTAVQRRHDPAVGPAAGPWERRRPRPRPPCLCAQGPGCRDLRSLQRADEVAPTRAPRRARPCAAEAVRRCAPAGGSSRAGATAASLPRRSDARARARAPRAVAAPGMDSVNLNHFTRRAEASTTLHAD